METWKQGSSAEQIVRFSQRINRLTEHLRQHKHDYHTRRSLMVIIGKRKRHIKYLAKTDPDTMKQVAKQVAIKY